MILFTSLLLVGAIVVAGIAIFGGILLVCAGIWKKINNLLPNNVSIIRRKGDGNKHYMNVVINGK